MGWGSGVCAIISDVHANHHALNAVLDDLSKEKIDRIFCLGDTVGYGAKPGECVGIVQERADFSILGNHDYAVLLEPQGFNSAAEVSARWTQRVLERSPKSDEYFGYIGQLSSREERDGVFFVHGSPRRPLDEYISPEDVFEAKKMEGCFQRIETLSFQGHTHLPGIFVDNETPTFIEYAELEDKAFKFEIGKKYMINVGSVGQPRDRDARACYAIFDGETCRYRRVPYDIEATIKEIMAIKDFEPFRHMALRLRDGR